MHTLNKIAQSAGTVKYIDFISTTDQSLTTELYNHDIKQSDSEVLVMQRTLKNGEFHFNAIAPRSTLTGFVAPNRVLAIGQIELLDI